MFGDTWRAEGGLGLDFWNWMWSKRHGTPMVEALIAEAKNHRRVLEVGCGAGHFLDDLAEAGWSKRSRRYVGYEFSEVAAKAAAERLAANKKVRGSIELLDFMADDGAPEADVVVANAVLEHQPRPFAFIDRALEVAPVVALGVGYIHADADAMSTYVDRVGHVDWRFGVNDLVEGVAKDDRRVEAAVVPNPLRAAPNHRELVLIIRR